MLAAPFLRSIEQFTQVIKPGCSVVQDRAAVVLASAGLQQLLLMLLALRMDPVGQLLAIEIQVCLLAHASRAWSVQLKVVYLPLCMIVEP